MIMIAWTHSEFSQPASKNSQHSLIKSSKLYLEIEACTIDVTTVITTYRHLQTLYFQ